MPRAKKPLAPTPIEKSEKQVITMPEAPILVRKSAPPTTVLQGDLESQIRERAYQLYQERGATPGHENEDWLRAESEIRGRQNFRQSA